MGRKPPLTLLGVLLLLTLALGLAGLVLAAVISDEPAVDFTATWRLQPDDALSAEVSENEEGVYTVSFAPPDAAWRREAVMSRVDRFQLAGRLGDVEGAPSGDDHLVIVGAATGASVSILSLNEDTVDVGVREAGAAAWTDLGTFKRGAVWSDPSRAAGWIMITVLAAMVAALVFQIPLLRTQRARHEPRHGEIVWRVVSLLAVVVLLTALLDGSPILALVSVLVLFATWLLKLVKWLPEEVTGTGAMLDYLLSPKRRDAFHQEATDRGVQAERGTDLERILQDVRDAKSEAARSTEPDESSG